MDVRPGRESKHVPAEIVDLIAEHLDTGCLLLFRRICKATNECAIKRLVKRSYTTPSEVFTEGHLDVADDDFKDVEHSQAVLTVWTWLLLPTSDPNDQVITEEIKEALVYPSYSGQMPTKNAGAGWAGICWGQAYENPALVAIVMRMLLISLLADYADGLALEFHDEETLLKYRSSSFAARHREALERKWPGVFNASSSVRWLLSQPPKSRHHLEGWPLTEIRTVYFKADMTTGQREIVNNSKNVSKFGYTVVPRSVADPGPTTWGWLKGLFIYKGQLAVAARYLIRWENQERIKRYRKSDAYRLWQGNLYPWAKVFELELDAAGRIGQEVYHCNFEPEFVRYD